MKFRLCSLVVVIVVLLEWTVCCCAFALQRSFYRPLRSTRSQMCDASVDVDVAVIGAGIAGSALSWTLQEKMKLRVALIDPRWRLGSWYPNYGAWEDDWQFVCENLGLPGMRACTTTEWSKADCFFGGSSGVAAGARTTIHRGYVRVDKVKLNELIKQRFNDAGGIAIAAKLCGQVVELNRYSNHSICHSTSGSSLALDNGQKVRCKVIIDASGFESKLIVRNAPERAVVPIGFQVAYGLVARVSSLGPYDPSAITLFDYRTDHYLQSESVNGSDRPTFLYVMPLGALPGGEHRVFVEETSLIARGERRVSIDECKRRLYSRLGFHGITVQGVEEEELCYIPMGGELPVEQRVIAFGGAAGMVHPATGYQATRMLSAVPRLAEIIAQGVKRNQSPEEISAAAYKILWPLCDKRQRAFHMFGGAFLMRLNVAQLRAFFTAFFALPDVLWKGFLAGYSALPFNEHHLSWDKRLQFAVKMLPKLPVDLSVRLVAFTLEYIAKHGLELVRVLTPEWAGRLLLDKRSSVSASPPDGDEALKNEARRFHSDFVSRENKSRSDFAIPPPYD